MVSILSQAFNKDNCDIYILAFETGELEKDCERGGAKVYIRPFQWRHAIKWLKQFVKELKAERIDVLHTHLFTADILGRLGGRLAGVPVIVSTIHAPSTWKRSKRLKDRVKIQLDRVTANYLSDCLFSISRQVSDYQIQYGGLNPSKISIISNPVMLDRFERNDAVRNAVRSSLGLNTEHTAVANVASLKHVKGQKYLLYAVRSIADKYPGIRLLLIGDGEDRDKLNLLAGELGISDHVIFLGNRLDVPDLLVASDIFVMPSLSEGISMAILEAMATELPIIATSVGGNPDIIEDRITGLLVDPADDLALANAIEILLNEPRYARSLGERAKQFVKDHHDAGFIACQLENAYRSIYQKKRTCEDAR